MRKGFSLITAMVFLILVATISALSIALSSQTAKQTGDIFLKSQAELLAKSATEYALLASSGHEVNATTGCLNSINLYYPELANWTHEANISIMYIGSGLPAGCVQLGGDIATADSNRTVIIDTLVSTNPAISNEPIRLHRRTIQKP
ncbi:MAG: type II secretion system protein [Sulfurospirillaceae bacterium]|nr:type II secretion system protein [Sulfurospirillaceae bacterium]